MPRCAGKRIARRRRSAPHIAPRPDSVRNTADADRSASSTAASLRQTDVAPPRAAGPAARRGSRKGCPSDGNRPRRTCGWRNAVPCWQADRRHRSSPSAGRSKAPIAARSAPASGREADDPMSRAAGRVRRPPVHRRGSTRWFRTTRAVRADCRWRPSRGGRPGRPCQAALPLIGMRRTFFLAASVRGSRTVSTPFLNVAFACSRSIPCGRLMRRSKRP